jgi:ferric-dicitrate binding protein FerR (iron transport regulator)
MTHQENIIWNAISSVLNQSATDEEKKIVENWLLQSAGNRKIYATIANIGYFKNIGDLTETKERILAQLQHKIERPVLQRRLKIYQFISAAAVALLLIVGSWMLFNRTNGNEPAFVETMTGNGCKSQITLSDGTKVDLNAGSKIQYPAHFNGKDRNVKLTGEAYFEVAKDSKHPFIVSVENIKIKVLGTHFNVKAFTDDGVITTTLIEGSVSVASIGNKKTFTLKPNQQLVYTTKTGNFALRNVEAKLFAGWKNNEYYFEHERFEQIARNIERIYNIGVIISSGRIGNETFSGSFGSKDNFYKVLEIMQKQKGFKYKVEKDSVFIYD